MAVVVSLLAAAMFGAGDFIGGVAAKRLRAIQVVAGSHIVGLLGSLLFALATGASATMTDLFLGVVGGLLGGVGVWFLYRRLAVGPMHVVAPVTAVSAAVVPTLWGFVIGERLSAAVGAGLVLALVAIALVSRSTPTGGEAPVTAVVVGESLLAGAGFGGFFVFLDATSAASAPWPVVSARFATGVGLALYLLATHRRHGASAAFSWLRSPVVVVMVVAVGVLDTAANVAFLWATSRVPLAVVSVLTSLYPIATVLLARAFLEERMNRWQQVGLAGAITASAIIGAA